MGRKIETVCTTNNVAYKDVRGAMIEGARTIEDLKVAVHVCGTCPSCTEHLDYIVTTCCGCADVSMQTIQDLIASGITDLDTIMDKTQAGTNPDCGKCQKLILNMIEQGY